MAIVQGRCDFLSANPAIERTIFVPLCVYVSAPQKDNKPNRLPLRTETLGIQRSKGPSFNVYDELKPWPAMGLQGRAHSFI